MQHVAYPDPPKRDIIGQRETFTRRAVAIFERGSKSPAWYEKRASLLTKNRLHLRAGPSRNSLFTLGSLLANSGRALFERPCAEHFQLSVLLLPSQFHVQVCSFQQPWKWTSLKRKVVFPTPHSGSVIVGGRVSKIGLSPHHLKTKVVAQNSMSKPHL